MNPNIEIYTIYDTKAQYYTRPFFARGDETAKRIITNTLAQKDNEFAMNPEDFQLYHLGSFNEDDGKITSNPPRHILNLVSLVKNLVSLEKPVE